MSPKTHSAGNGSAKPASRSARPDESEPLTPRELEVAEWIGHGKGNEEIAIILKRSKPTVKKHVQNILRKLRLETRLAVCAWWHEGGKDLVSSGDEEAV